MFIGLGRYELFLSASGSLKDKRQVLRSVVDVVNKRFSASIAEVDHQDLWQRSVLGVSVVSGSMDHCQRVLDQVERTIEKVIAGRADIVDRWTEHVSMEDL